LCVLYSKIYLISIEMGNTNTNRRRYNPPLRQDTEPANGNNNRNRNNNNNNVYFGNTFLPGQRINADPDNYYLPFGGINSINFNRPPPEVHKTVTVASDINLRKATLSLTCQKPKCDHTKTPNNEQGINNNNSSDTTTSTPTPTPTPTSTSTGTAVVDTTVTANTTINTPQETDQAKYQLYFKFDARVDCTISIYYNAIEIQDDSRTQKFSSTSHSQFIKRFEKGLAQEFFLPEDQWLPTDKVNLEDLVYNPLSEAYPVIICIDTNPINPELIIDLNHINEPPSPSPNTIPLVATTLQSPTQDNKQPDTTNNNNNNSNNGNNSTTTALSNSTPGTTLQPVKKKK